MNKQQLASKIWESANKMRSKIEANEYKDYILGFIFYKFLSDKEENTLRNMGLSGNLKVVTEDNQRIVKTMQERIGYFIAYDNLFSTWLSKKNDFDVSNVRDALSAFNRLINESHKKVFEKIFDTLQTGLSKLGDNSKSQTKAISDLIYLIKDIPMDGKQDYDVLGYIYEYLISNFAANAGKKAGEFYTPHEVSQLMSDIIANHLKNREDIEIYDPTSGSGSLLINIGNSVAKYVKDSNKIKYYAQELKQNTYNLTRMNLIMRGILPDNIVTRNGDTLEDDWPFFDEKHEYTPLFIDAVVSNPPYSQNWNPQDKEADPRYKEYGLAPKAKADYAFLLHDLYHLKSDGIMTIVLPHGVLFRGGEEKEIRKSLIEKNNIDTIIGLPANIFFGTGIPTIIMVLKKQKNNTDIQIIDASKGFIKDGKNNKLRACDIKKIVDTVIVRKDVEKYSRVVSREEIRENDYNLNIPRYVDSSDEQETFDIYASMFGGIPKEELDNYNEYFDVFPDLKKDLFKQVNENYFELEKDNIYEYIKNHKDIIKYKDNFRNSFYNFEAYLSDELIANSNEIKIGSEENKISNEIFKRMNEISLIDKYKAYQILDDEWTNIASDIELIQTEGLQTCNKVDPKTEIKKKNGKEEEVQIGWKGRVIPFELVQEYKMKDEVKSIRNIENRLEEISSFYQETIESLSEDEKEEITDMLNETNDAFVNANIVRKAKETIKSVQYNEEIDKRIREVAKVIDEEKELKKEQKTLETKLQNNSKKAIEELSENEIKELLKIKWIKPIVSNINKLVEELINDFSKKIENLSKKYEKTLMDAENEILTTEKELSLMIDELVGDEYDMKGLNEFKSLLNGGVYGK